MNRLLVIIAMLSLPVLAQDTIFFDGFENHDPVITTLPTTNGAIGKPYVYDVDATDIDGHTLLYLLTTSPAGMTIDPGSGLIEWTPDALGTYPVEVEVSDGKGGADVQVWDIEVLEIIDSDGDGLSDDDEAIAGTDPNDPDSDDDGVLDGAEVFTHETDPLDPDTDNDTFLDGSELAVGTDPLDPEDYPLVPPDPAEVAPEPDTSVAANARDSTAFLYTGPDPIQTGVAEDTIELKRAALLRGKVLTRLGAPLPGVTVSVLGHPEFGSTLSRADGMFDLAVNGGGALTIDYQLTGFLPAQRTVDAGWQEYVVADDVALIPLDPVVTSIDLDEPGDMKVARGSMQTDDDGSRQATILFPAGVGAELRMPDDSMMPISGLSVRATEYTVGDSGEMAMPGDLPPTSGYTYAVELSVDEAMAMGAASVDFDQPLPFYVENFLGFPAGTPVPTGYFDRNLGAWVPAPDGLVIKILSETGGMANVDIDGDDLADTGAPLADLGITDAERTQIAGLYEPGQSLWRVPVEHFTSWDHNWPIGPPADAEFPNQSRPYSDTIEDGICEIPGGSFFECQNQVLRERVAITGTPFTLNYNGSRSPGRLAARHLDIPLTDDSNPASLLRVDVRVAVSGQVYDFSYDAAPGLIQPLTWDGLDAFGRPVQGSSTANVRIGYVYEGVYRTGGMGLATFGQSGQLPIEVEGNRTRADFILPQEYSVPIGAWDARGQGPGGWTLDVHHAYDPVNKVLYRGDGTQRSAENIPNILTNVAGAVDQDGYGIECVYWEDPTCGDGLPATEATLTRAYHTAFGPDGSLYIVDGDVGRVRRVRPDGIIENFAGNGESYVDSHGMVSPNGDGGPADQAKLASPYSIAVDSVGNVFIGETRQQIQRIRKVDTNGIITTYAGTGEIYPPNGPALEVDIWPLGMDADEEGNLYVTDYCTVSRIDTAGRSAVVAGNEDECDNFTGDGGPAVFAGIGAEGLALGPDGAIYLADSGLYRIRRITKDGIIQTVAGTGVRGPTGDGGPATSADLDFIYDIAVAKDGSIYLPEEAAAQVRVIDPDGIIRKVAGIGLYFDVSGLNGPAPNAWIYPEYVEIGPDGSPYVTNSGDGLILVIKSALAGLGGGEILVPAKDGSEVYRFDSGGKHLQTLHALTGAVLLEFGYDVEGRLLTVTDGDGNVTTIQRDGSGNPTGILGPYGQVTTLTTDANDFLMTISNPADETWALEATPEGLLTQITDPEENTSQYQYDDLGRLTRVDDAAGGFQTFERTQLANGYEVTRTTALGRTTTYRVEQLPLGSSRLTTTLPSGDVLQSTWHPDGTQDILRPDGSVVQHIEKPDPRFGMQAPLSSITVSTPGGLVSETLVTQAAVLSDPYNPLTLQTLTSSVSVNGRNLQSVYDAATREFTDTTPANRQTTRTIELSGRLATQQVAGLEPSVTSYDASGRLASVTQGGGETARTVTYVYGGNGRLASLTDPLMRDQTFQYDAANRTIGKTLRDGESVSFDYDENGNTISVTPPGRPAHQFTYTPRNRILAFLPPEVGGEPAATAFTYDADRALDVVTRPDGLQLDYAYDAAGRLMSVLVPGGQYDYTYGPANRIATIATPDGEVLSYTYDGFLLTDIVWSGTITGSVARTYDDGFRKTMFEVNGQGVSFGYDDDDLVIQAGGLSVQRNAQNGLAESATLGQVTSAWSRNSFGEISAYDVEYSGNPVFEVEFERDTLGRITQKVETVDAIQTTFDYVYDEADRLIEVRTDDIVTESYSYDANGNRLDGPTGSTTYTTDNQDRLLTMTSVSGTTDYEYNANGERASKTLGEDVATYEYDVLGNLRSVVLEDGTEIDYLIDGRGRRIGKRINGTLVQGFLYQDGRSPVAQLDAGNVVVSRFVYAGSTSVPAYLVRDATTYRIVTDPIGSPRLVIDVATGTVAQQLDYDAFGNVTLDTNPGFQPFGFAGGLYDTDTGLLRFGFRDYDPEVGRWTAKDPVGFLGGQLNLYSYALNDPVNNFDLTGLAPKDLGTGIPAIDDFLRNKSVFDSIKKWFGYYEDTNKINKNIDAINDIQENNSLDSGHKGKEAFSHFLEICKTAINKIPGANGTVTDIIGKTFESAAGLLEKGADVFDTYPGFDEEPGFTPVPSTPAEPYIPGDAPPGESPATRLIDDLERMGWNEDL